jgi:hypothetical protein
VPRGGAARASPSEQDDAVAWRNAIPPAPRKSLLEMGLQGWNQLAYQ